MNKLRVIFDTNVIVSAALFTGSIPQLAFDLALEKHEILVSSTILDEVTEVLSRPKFDKYDPSQKRQKVLGNLATGCSLVEITSSITDCRDPKDNKFLELAVDGKADYLITGDRDLLVLHLFQNTQILTPAQFLELETT